MSFFRSGLLDAKHDASDEGQVHGVSNELTVICTEELETERSIPHLKTRKVSYLLKSDFELTSFLLNSFLEIFEVLWKIFAFDMSSYWTVTAKCKHMAEVFTNTA